MKTCQWILLALFSYGAFYSMLKNFIPQKAKDAYGMLGIIVDLIFLPLIFYVYYTAGAFSLIFQ